MSGIDKLPDLSDWLIVEVWTIEEAALLWAGINPLDAAGCSGQVFSDTKIGCF